MWAPGGAPAFDLAVAVTTDIRAVRALSCDCSRWVRQHSRRAIRQRRRGRRRSGGPQRAGDPRGAGWPWRRAGNHAGFGRQIPAGSTVGDHRPAGVGEVPPCGGPAPRRPRGHVWPRQRSLCPRTHNGDGAPSISGRPRVNVIHLLRHRVTQLLRQCGGEYVDVMVTLLQTRGTCGRSGQSLISVYVSQASEGDRGVPVDTGCRPQFTSRFCEASRWVRACEPSTEAGARRHHP